MLRDRWTRARPRSLKHAFALGAATAALGSTALAQTAAASNEISEIVVTAQKQAESLQQVPIAVSVASGEQIQNTHTSNLEALSGALPNVQIGRFTNNTTNAVFTIRGIGVSATDPYAGNSVAAVQDEVPFHFPQMALSQMFDIERIEVLRGPQGTLFGANTTGGVINIITRRPTDQYEGSGQVTLGSRNRLDAEGVVNMPLAEGLSARLAAFHHSQDGFTTNIVDGRSMGDENIFGVRASLRYEPTPDLQLTLIGEADRVRNGNPYVVNAAVPGELLYVAPGTRPPGQFMGQYPSPCVPAGSRCHAPDKYFAANAGAEDSNDLDVNSLTLLGNWKLPFGELVSVTGFKNYRLHYVGDEDGTGFFQIESNNHKTYGWQFTQEVRVNVEVSPTANLIAGAFYIKNHYDQRRSALLNFAGPLRQYNTQDQSNWSGSAFLQGYWDVTEKLRLQAGARATHERTRMTAETLFYMSPTGTAMYRDDVPIPPGPGSPSVPLVTDAKSWDNVGWKVGADYKITPDVMAYAYYARGFKSGGFSGLLAVPTDIGPYDPEYVNTAEVGLKALWWDRRLRLNVAIFHNKYKDLQLNETYFVGTATGVTIVNAANAVTKGVEVEATLIPIAGLTLNGSIAYLSAHYKEFPYADPFAGGAIKDLSGNRLNNAPKWTYALNAQYRFNIGESVMTAFVQYRHTDDLYNYDILTGPRSNIQARNFLDGNVEWKPDADARWALSVWARNILDKRYIASVVEQTGVFGMVNYDPPREYGVTVKYEW